MPSKTITVTNGDGSTRTITIPDRSRFAGVKTIERGYVYPTIAGGSFTNSTGTTFTKADEQTFTIVSSSTTANSYINFTDESNDLRIGKHRIAFDLALNSGSVNTVTGFYTDSDSDPSNGGSYGSYSLTEGYNVIDFEIFDDGVGHSPRLLWSVNIGSTFDISVTNFKVTHEPDTVTTDHTAVVLPSSGTSSHY